MTDELDKSGDRPAITPAMIYAARVEIAGVLSWEDADAEEKDAAVVAALIAMLSASDDLRLLEIGRILSSGHVPA